MPQKPDTRGLIDKALDWTFRGDADPPKVKNLASFDKRSKWEDKHTMGKLTEPAKKRALKQRVRDRSKWKYADTDYKGMGTYGRTGAEHGVFTKR